MKQVLLFILLSMVIMSCSKGSLDDLTTDDDEAFIVRFNSPQIAQSQRPMSANANLSSNGLKSVATDNSIKQILFVVCNENHFPLFNKLSTNSEPFEFKLKNGKYIIKAFATTFDQSESKFVNDNNATALYIPQSTFAGPQGNMVAYQSGEVFMGNSTIDVSKDSTYSTLILNRLSSKIELNIKDLSPPDLGYIEVHTDIGHVLLGGVGSSPFEGNRYSGNTLVPDNRVTYSTVTDAKIFANKSNFVVPFHFILKGLTTLNMQERVTHVTIRTYDTSNKMISTKVLNNIKLIPNTITELTGNMFEAFNGDKQGALNISYKTEYSTDRPNYIF